MVNITKLLNHGIERLTGINNAVWLFCAVREYKKMPLCKSVLLIQQLKSGGCVCFRYGGVKFVGIGSIYLPAFTKSKESLVIIDFMVCKVFIVTGATELDFQLVSFTCNGYIGYIVAELALCIPYILLGHFGAHHHVLRVKVFRKEHTLVYGDFSRLLVFAGKGDNLSTILAKLTNGL